MAKKISSDIRVFYDGYDIGTALTSTQLSVSVDPLDPTSLGDNAERVIAGKRNDAVEIRGLYDDGADALNAAQAIIGNGTGQFTVQLGNTIGNIAYSGTNFMGALKAPASIGDLIRQEAVFKPDEALVRGIILTPKESLSGAADPQTGTHDNSALSTAGCKYFVHCFTLASGTAGVVLEHSSDGTTWAAFGTVVGLAAQKSTGTTFTGTLNRYTRTSRAGDAAAETIAAVLARL